MTRSKTNPDRRHGYLFKVNVFVAFDLRDPQLMVKQVEKLDAIRPALWSVLNEEIGDRVSMRRRYHDQFDITKLDRDEDEAIGKAAP